MRLFRICVLALPLFLAGCDLSDQQKADYASVRRSGVSSATYDKMMHGDPLSLYDIKSLARAGVSDGVILRYLRDHATVYSLNSGDVTDLRKAGVSQSIVDYMLQTPGNYSPVIYPSIGIGFGYDPFWYGPGSYWGGGYYGGYHGHH